MSSPVFGQLPLFQSFRLPEKNEHLEINKILQDEVGFVWLATKQGLLRFDGNDYKLFNGNLPDENVTALAQDSIGRMWVGFSNGKIGVIDKDRFTAFIPEEGLPIVQISDILFDREGVLWFSTYSDGIYYYFNNRLYRVDDMDGMPDLYAYDLEEDEQGRIWVGTDGGVAVCSRTKNSVVIRTINYSNGLPDNIIRKISRGKANTMLLGMEDAGVISFDNTTDTTIQILREKWTYGSIDDFVTVDDWTWVATTQGLAVLDWSDTHPSVKMLPSGRVTALGGDAEGGVWVASSVGVQHTMGKQIQFLLPEGDPNVMAVTVGADQDVWFATANGLFRQTKKNGNKMLTTPLKGTPFEKKKVISLYTDPQGFIWVGFYGDGVIRLHPKNRDIKYFNKELLNGNVVNISGKNGTVWLATLGGASEIKSDQNFSIKNYSQADGLATDYLYQVFTDSEDRVWFATDRDGVDMLDAKGIHHFKENLFLKVVCGFAEDTLHRVWANVQNEGLFVFDGDGFKPSASQLHLHDTNFSSLSSGQNGQLMAVHRSGIDFLDVAKNETTYIRSSGEQIAPNLNAIGVGREGVFVGTNKGLFVFHHAVIHKQNLPIPFIERFEVNSQAFDWKKSNSLKYNQNNITIGFTGFWYQNPTAINFAYKLENFDDEWITSDNRSVTYPKLPPGEYTFRLKVSDSGDFSNSAETKITFLVKPPFWSTTWFYVLLALTLFIFSYWVVQYRERKLVRDKRALEANVVRRTLEIQEKSNEIKLQAEEIKLINENLESIVKDRTQELERKNQALEEYAFINAHKLRAPLARILGLVHLMKKSEVSEDEKVYMEHLHQASRELDEVISSITQALERGSYDAGELNLD